MLAVRHESGSAIERYADALRLELTLKDIARLGDLPPGELVLLLSKRDAPKGRIVIRIENGSISVLENAADYYLPQAVVACGLEHWLECVRSGRIVNLDDFDIFGELRVLTTFFAIYRLKHSPMDSKCRSIIAARGRRPHNNLRIRRNRR